MATEVLNEAKIDIGRVVGRGFETIGRQLVPFVTLAVILAGIPALISALLLPMNDPEALLQVFLSPVYWALLVVQLIAASLLNAALVRASVRDLRGEPVEVGSNLLAALKLVLPLILLTILVVIVTTFGAMLLIVPGIILYLMFIVAVPVLVEEKRGIIASMSRSKQLTKGSRWRIFLLLLLVGVVYLVVGYTSGAVAGPYTSVPAPVAALVRTVAATLTGLVTAAMVASLYVELRSVKEGGDELTLSAIFA